MQLRLIADAAQLVLPVGTARLVTSPVQPVQLAGAVNHGHWHDGRSAGAFACNSCGWSSSFRPATEAELRRGIPCPVCQAAQTEASAGAGDDWTTGLAL